MTRIVRLAIAWSLLAVIAACAASPPPAPKEIPTEGFGGTWVMNLGKRTFIVLTLERMGDAFTGTLSRPERFATTNGIRFSNLGSETTTENVVGASIQNDRLHFMTKDPTSNEGQREYEMALTGQDTASIRLANLPLEPWPFTRVKDANPRVVFTDWEPRHSYSLHDDVPPSAEMQRIYEAHMQARQNVTQFSRAAEAPAPGDVERRSETRRLLADGRIRLAEDYTRAAHVFQFSPTPDDFLLAHSLAMVGAARGDEDALWIAAATLDRYLQATGKRQIFGTQIKERADHTATLEPYNRELVIDTLRSELGVQPIAVQEEQLESWTEQFKAAAASR